MQVSEPARLLMLMYLSGYAVRHRAGTARAVCRFRQADVAGCGLHLLPVVTRSAGFRCSGRHADRSHWRCCSLPAREYVIFLLLSLGVLGALVLLAKSSPYRMARITTFLDPWADPYDSGFQLTQSLIAIGSGEWHGVGLGGSMQKLFYLPEAHTDFVFAVIAEEFGLLGSIVVIGLFATLVWRAFGIARESAANGRLYQANLAFGFAIWQGVQAFINIGVNMGILPTKGLTLPLISYGRSSLVVTLVGLGLLLRIDYENRQLINQTHRKRATKRRTRKT